MQDLPDAICDPEVCNETKSVAEKAGGWTFDILKDIASVYDTEAE